MTWLTSWTYRKSHTMNQKATAEPNWQVGIKVYKGTGTDGTETVNGLIMGKVYCNNHCRDDFADIRFTRSDGTTLEDHWLETETLVNGVSAVFWIEISGDLSLADVTIYIYYGYSGASSASNGDNTFLRFDDFLGSTLDTTKWDYFAGDPGDFTFADSILHIYKVKGTAGLINKVFTPRPYILEALSIIIKRGATWIYLGERCQDGSDDARYYCGNANDEIFSRNNGVYTELDSTYDCDAYARQKMICLTNLTRWYSNGVQVPNSPISSNVPDEAGGLFICVAGSQGTHDMWVNWIFSRKATADGSEPTHGAWGEEEQKFLFVNLYETLTLSDSVPEVYRLPILRKVVNILCQGGTLYQAVLNFVQELDKTISLTKQKSQVELTEDKK